jgi:uncharacterized protein (TIGR00106 family)
MVVEKQVVAEISVVPLGTAKAGLSEYIAACCDILENIEGISCQLTPMGTILEGPLDQVLEAVRRVHEVPFTLGALRVITSVKIDDRRDKKLTMSGKLESVAKKRTPGGKKQD